MTLMKAELGVRMLLEQELVDKEGSGLFNKGPTSS
jgi:hypothetical protein